MTAAEQQISGNPAAMENAQARTTVTDQAKVQDIISRMDRAHETPMFHRIVTLVAAGMLMDSIDVYIGSAVASSTLATRWSTVAQNSTFMSAGFLGLLVGSLLAGFVGDLKGRRVAYQINLLLFGGFTFLGAFAPNMAVLSLCRLGAGLGLGAEIVTGFAMVNEFAPMNRRGHWCAIVSLVANCGVPIAMLLCAWIIPRWSWRPLFVAIGLVAAIIWWLRRDIPESPRWLAVRGRYDEADAIVKQLEANGSEPIDAAAKADTSDTRNAGGRSLVICLLVAVVSVAATNVCSYAFTSWVPTILVKRGINLSSSLLTSTVMMLGAPVGCLIGSLLIDRIGRKRTIVPAFLFTGVFGLMYARERNYRWLPAHDVPVRAYGFRGGCVRSGTVRHQGSLPLRRLRERRGQAAQCVDADGGGLDAYLAWCHVHLCGHQRDCYCIDADCRLLWRGDCAEVGWVIGFLTVE